MKVAVSIPGETFGKMEKQARKEGLNRSAFVSKAVEKYLRDLKHAEMARKLKEVYAKMDEADKGLDPFVAAATRETFKRNEW